MSPPLDIPLSNTKKNLARAEAIATLIAVGLQSMKAAHAPFQEFEVMRMFKGGQVNLWIWAAGAGE